MNPVLLTSSPAAAYRADMAARQEPFGADDDRWLMVASMLHQAAQGDAESAKPVVLEALAMALGQMGQAMVDALSTREWDGERSRYEALMLFADRLHDAGALHLAARMFDDLAACSLPLTPLERGRLLAMRARVEWKLGNHDDAADRYRFIQSLGASHKEPELTARAALGLGTIAQLRGNLPEFSTFMERAARVAEQHQLKIVARRAYQALTVVLAKREQFDDALMAAWRTLEMSGSDPVLQAEALQNLGQLLLETGHPAQARSSFAAVLSRPIGGRLLLPALGGIAVASAQLGAEPTVEWAVREIWRARTESVPRYELAAALLEGSQALARLNRTDESDRYREAALHIVEASEFHELAHVAARAPSQRGTAPLSLSREAAAVGARVAALEPRQLPERLDFDAVAV